MKTFNALLHFINNDEELNEDEEIKNWTLTEVKLDDNDYVYMYDIETTDGELIEVTIHVTKEV